MNSLLLAEFLAILPKQRVKGRVGPPSSPALHPPQPQGRGGGHPGRGRTLPEPRSSAWTSILSHVTSGQAGLPAAGEREFSATRETQNCPQFWAYYHCYFSLYNFRNLEGLLTAEESHMSTFRRPHCRAMAWPWAFLEGCRGRPRGLHLPLPGVPGKGTPGKQPHDLPEMSHRVVLTY